jgi:hypothetical protein
LANFLTDETLMSSLTQSAATFVAILAGFYTTKILTIAGDKSRIEHKINYSKSEISFETEKYQKFKIRKKYTRRKANQLLQYFVEIKDKFHFPVFPNINTYDDLIA